MGGATDAYRRDGCLRSSHCIVYLDPCTGKHAGVEQRVMALGSSHSWRGRGRWGTMGNQKSWRDRITSWRTDCKRIAQGTAVLLVACGRNLLGTGHTASCPCVVLCCG